MKSLKFSERYILKNGWATDLGEDGEVSLPDTVLFDEEENLFKAIVTYSFDGWTFTDCELIVDPDVKEENVEWAEDVWETKWKCWTITPTSETKVLNRGKLEALDGTTFEEYGEENEVDRF